MGRKTHGPYLLAAIEHNDIQKINEILNQQIRNKTKTKEFLVSDVRRLASEFSEVPLLLAACNEDPTIIKYFVTKHGADINHVHEEGYGRKKKRKTALIMAVRRGLYATVDAILALNADVNEQDHKGRTALHHAVRKADFRMAKMLCSRGAQVNIMDKANNTPLHIATIFGHQELVKVLIKFGGDLYKKGQHGAIPIHIAAREGHSNLVRLFCQYEVNVNIKVPCYEGQEKAPIHVAAEEGHAETVFALLDSCGADVGLRDSEGETPLHCSVIREYDPLGMKSKEDYTETVKVLLNFASQVNIQNRRGETPLHLAARNEFQKIVEVLVLAGADPLIEDYDKNKPMDLVFPDDTVTRQLLKNAQEERERYMSEAMEVRARGFTTSVPKPLPLSMRSQSTMNMLGGYGGTMSSNMSRAASVPGLLGPSQPLVYEDGYLQPLGSRSNIGAGLSVSQSNTYRSEQSRSTGSSSGSHPMNPQSTYDNINDAQIESRARGSDSSQPDIQGPMMNGRIRTKSEGQVIAPESPYIGRSLPSPPREKKFGPSANPPPGARGVRASQQSEVTSIWSVSSYPDGGGSDDESVQPRGRIATAQPRGPAKAAGIRRQASPLRFVPAGPHGAPIAEQDSDDDESYFDDESFDTLDDLSVEEVDQQTTEQAKKRLKELNAKNKSGSQASLHDWLEEQADLLKEQNKGRGPVAQSTPPQARAPKRSDVAYDTTTDTASEFSEIVPPKGKGHGPAIPPKPQPREKNPPKKKPIERRPGAPPPPPPKGLSYSVDDEVADLTQGGAIERVIELGVDDRTTPGQTVIRIVSTTPTNTQTPTDGVLNRSKQSEAEEAPKTRQPKVPRREAVQQKATPEKPKVSKKPKLKAKPSQEEHDENEMNNNKPKKKTTTAKPKKKANNLQWQKAGGDHVYDNLKESETKSEDSDDHGSSSTEEPLAQKKPVPQKRAGFMKVEKVETQENEEPESPNTWDKKQVQKQDQALKRQQMFQEQLLQDQEQREALNREKERQKQLELEEKRELQHQAELRRQQEYERQQEAIRQQQQQQQQQIQQQQSPYALPGITQAEIERKRKVTIGSEEVIQVQNRNNGLRNVVYSYDGSMLVRLVGGNAEGVYVSEVDINSDAAQQGVKIGDQIIKVNGRSMKKKTKEEVFAALANSSTKVSLLLKENREKCVDLMENGGEGDSFFVEALFDYDPTQSGELIIRKGDIYCIKDSLPDGAPGSWKAVKMSGKTVAEQAAWKPLMASKKGEDEAGLIPNVVRAKQIMVKDSLLSNKPTNRGGLFTRSFGRSKSADRLNKNREAERKAEAEAQMIPYKKVKQEHYKFKRPVVLLGLFCDAVRQQLLKDSPDFFESPGSDVEVPNNAGPVDLRVIKYVMDRNKHCLIIMSPKAIDFLLNETDMDPMVIYLAPNNKSVVKYVKSRLAPEYDRKVNYMYDEAVKFERQHASLFTVQVPYTDDDSWFVTLKNTIFQLQDQVIWRPLRPHEDSDDEDDDDDISSAGPALGRGRAANRISKTTDDLPDQLQHTGQQQMVRGAHQQSQQQGPSYSEDDDDDTFDSDDTEDDVDVGMRRPLPPGGTFYPVDPVQRPTGNLQPRPYEYAQPTAQQPMRNRNRSEGDILQYLNSDVDNLNPGNRPVGRNTGAGMHYGNTGRYSGDYDQYNQSFHRQPEVRQSGGGGRPPVAGIAMPGMAAGPQGQGYPAYEYMQAPAQAPQYYTPQGPNVMQQRRAPNAAIPGNRETQL